jgi:predicted nucleic acid-binding protein
VLTLDTNVIVRLLVGDDPRQTPIAERAFLEAIATGGVYLPDVVLAEVAWVLRGYGLDRPTQYAQGSGSCEQGQERRSLPAAAVPIQLAIEAGEAVACSRWASSAVVWRPWPGSVTPRATVPVRSGYGDLRSYLALLPWSPADNALADGSCSGTGGVGATSPCHPSEGHAHLY